MKKWSSQWTQFFFSGFFTQLHKLRSLRRSFLNFHFISAVHIWFISHIITTHFFHVNIWTHHWPAPNVSGFIAQLVEHCTSIARSRVQTPLNSWLFWGFTATIISSFSFHFRSSYMIYFIYHYIYLIIQLRPLVLFSVCNGGFKMSHCRL